MTKIKKEDWSLIIFILVICSLLMLPRILSAHFGLLDDGVLILNAQQSLGDFGSILYQFQGVGRFLPTALMFRTFVFSFAGFDAQRWYIWSSLLLIILCLEMAYIVKRYGFNRIQALLSVMLFVASPTLIENFYTLSKAEIPLLLLISSAVLLAMTYVPSSIRFTKICIVVFCFLLLLFSFGAKETAIVLPFLFLSWLVISWIYFRSTGEYRDLIQGDWILLVGSLIGCILYWTLRSLLGISDVSSYSGGYQLFNTEKILFNFKVLLGWLIRDYPYLLPILLAMIFVKPLRQTKTALFALRWISWMGAWALILLPWNYLSYYLLPFLFGSALFSGIMLGEMLNLLLSKNDSNSKRHFAQYPSMSRIANRNWLAILCIASFILMIPPAFNATAYATEQLVFDQANWQFIEQVVKLPPNSRLLVNLPSQEEYFYEIKLFVGQILNRPDISIEAYQPPILFDHEQNVYLASPLFINQILPRVRALNSIDVIEWRRCVRGVERKSDKVFSISLERPLLDIGLHRLLFFLHGSDMIGNSNRNIIVRTSIIYGWDLWQLSPSRAASVRAAVYKDGVFILQTLSGDFKSISFGKSSGTPLAGDVNGDGFTDLIIYDEYMGIWMVDRDLDGSADQSFNLPEMQTEDIPLIGDWDGDGMDTVGFFRPSNVSWYLYNHFAEQVATTYQFGEAFDIPIAGDWNGDGMDEIGVYRPETGYTLLVINPYDLGVNSSFNGLPNTVPVVASWDGANRDTLAFVNGNTWTIYPFNDECYPANPLKSFQLEYTGIPLAIYGSMSE